jgi:hypothetical protein
MTNLPDDLIDPAEGRLIRRVGAYTDRAVVPIDPVAIVAAASATRRSMGLFSGLGGRLGVLGAGAALVLVAIGGAIGIGALTAPSPTPIATQAANANQTSDATPAAVATDPPLCIAVDLDGRIVRWEGAAGSRIATVELRSTAAGDCSLPSDPTLALLDADGVPLIVGATEPWHAAISPGGVLHSMVRVGNYCGSEGRDPVMIHVEATFADGKDSLSLFPTAGGLSGVPPCNGPAGSNGDIEMQPWQQGPAPAV